MRRASAATHLTIAFTGELDQAVEAARPTAAELLGGEDGLVCISASRKADSVAMIWRREWDEQDAAEAPKEDEQQ